MRLPAAAVPSASLSLLRWRVGQWMDGRSRVAAGDCDQARQIRCITLSAWRAGRSAEKQASGQVRSPVTSSCRLLLCRTHDSSGKDVTWCAPHTHRHATHAHGGAAKQTRSTTTGYVRRRYTFEQPHRPGHCLSGAQVKRHGREEVSSPGNPNRQHAILKHTSLGVLHELVC